ncbi:MAG: zinc ABC transporter solute-binding protein [Aquificae bacterium]|nr:zinc ABC transporter solute-binding protein [Aquificota bacterium]
MKPILILLVFAFAFSKDLLLVSIYPFLDVTKDVAGEDYRVESLVPPKADYHLYELTPRELIKLYVARVLFVSGVPLGEWEEKASRITRAHVFSLSEGIELLTYGHEKLGKDPHFWTSPKRMIQVSKNIKDALSRVYKGKDFTRGYKKAEEKLSSLHTAYEKGLSRCAYRTFGALHPAFGYIAKDYNLKQVVLQEEHGHGDLSPSQLKKLLSAIKKNKIKVILVPLGVESQVARLLREEYKIPVYEVNVKIIPQKQGDNYYTIMEENLRVLREALRCE